MAARFVAVVLFALIVPAAAVAQVEPSSPANNTTLYRQYSGGTNTADVRLEYVVRLDDAEQQITSCEATVQKDGGNEQKLSSNCEPRLLDQAALTFSLSSIVEAADANNTPEGEYAITVKVVYQFAFSGGDEESGVIGEVDNDPDRLVSLTMTARYNLIIDDTPPGSFSTDGTTSPRVLDPRPGENRLEARWERISDDIAGKEEPARVEYDVCVDPQVRDGTECLTDDGARLVKGGESLSLDVTGLDNGIVYSVRVRGRDKSGNLGAFSPPVQGSPVPVDDFWEYYKRNGGREKGGFCFIATAASGSAESPTVVALSLFRDEILAASPWGNRLIYWYYVNGRAAADHLAVSPWLRVGTLLALQPVTWFAWLAVTPHLWAKVVVGALLSLWLGVRIRRRGVRT